jgi:creatinine amidohydrolase
VSSGAERAAAVRDLAQRMDDAATLVRDAVRVALPELPWTAARRIFTTGLGSSAAHARLLAQLLHARAGLRAAFLPTSALAAGPPPGSEDDLLVVFSQGLSPGARFALAHPGAWRRLALVTGVRERDAEGTPARDAEAKAIVLRGLGAAGASIVPLPAGDERGTLLRVGGPLAGYAVALRLAADAARAAGRVADARALRVDPDRIVPLLAAARARADAAWDAAGGLDSATPLALLAFGAYAPLLGNLPAKVLEGWLVPAPPIVDLLELAHGPLQQLHPRPATLLAFTRSHDVDGAAEAAALALLESDLDLGRHWLVRLDAQLPAPLSLFEHETMMNALVLRGIEATRIDPSRWPLQDPEPALYRHVPASPDAPATTPAPAAPPSHRLDLLTWPEVEALVAAGHRTAVVALGATEQHGPHLGLGTDTWIAGALAERFCARVPGAVLAATLPVGCSPEHLAFPGTLSLRGETLAAVLGDLVGSLARHRFEEVVVVSAHGGNAAPLASALPGLRAAHPGVRLFSDTDLGRLAALQRAASARHGVPGAESGHHAGEFETSIVLDVRPDGVRRDRLAPGLPSPEGDAQDLFFPSLRARAPSGVVGDPRRADAARAADYLDAWADELVAAYRRAKNDSHTNGTKSA